MSKPASIYMIERTTNGQKKYWENESRMWTTLEEGDAVGVKLIGDILTSAIENSGPDFRIIELVLPDDITPTQTSPSPEPEIERMILESLEKFLAIQLAKENLAPKKESYRGVIETTYSDEGKTERIIIQFPKGNQPPFGADWMAKPPVKHPWYEKYVTLTIDD